MILRRIVVDRIELNLEGLPVGQAELVAAQLQAALAAQSFATAEAGDANSPADGELRTSLTGEALVRAVAARLAHLVAAAPQETTPWP